MKADVIETARSINGKEIRLTLKQWCHIVEAHDYMAGNMEKVMETIVDPDYLVGGLKGEVTALKHYSQTNITEKHFVVVYREKEGFIITAFMTPEPARIVRRGIIWRK